MTKLDSERTFYKNVRCRSIFVKKSSSAAFLYKCRIYKNDIRILFESAKNVFKMLFIDVQWWRGAGSELTQIKEFQSVFFVFFFGGAERHSIPTGEITGNTSTATEKYIPSTDSEYNDQSINQLINQTINKHWLQLEKPVQKQAQRIQSMIQLISQLQSSARVNKQLNCLMSITKRLLCKVPFTKHAR